MRMKTIDRETFDKVKTLLNLGMTADLAATYTGVSRTTAYRIGRADTLEAMVQATREMNERSRVKRATPPAPVAPAPAPVAPAPAPVEAPTPAAPAPVAPVMQGYNANRMLEMLKEQNDLLKLISNKLAFIVEQLV